MSTPPNPPDDQPADQPDARPADSQPGRPSGIRGWMLLPTAVLLVAPFRFISGVMGVVDVLRGPTWGMLTHPTGPYYHKLWKPVLWLELSASAAMLFLVIGVLAMLFAKHRLFPRAAVALFAVNLVYAAVDFVGATTVAASMPAELADPITAAATSNLIVAVLVAGVLIPYLKAARRVANTFVR